MTLIALEFYSGIGGMRYGLERSGIPAAVAAAFDINDVANLTYAHNFKDQPCQGNIQRLSAAELDRFGADLWLLSPPCQPYTRQGLRKDSADARASSFLSLLAALATMRRPPRFLLLENVVGFEVSRTRHRMAHVLSSLGFLLEEFLLCPSQFGLPYSRPRYFACCRREVPAPLTSLQAPTGPPGSVPGDGVETVLPGDDPPCCPAPLAAGRPLRGPSPAAPRVAQPQAAEGSARAAAEAGGDLASAGDGQPQSAGSAAVCAAESAANGAAPAPALLGCRDLAFVWCGEEGGGEGGGQWRRQEAAGSGEDASAALPQGPGGSGAAAEAAAEGERDEGAGGLQVEEAPAGAQEGRRRRRQAVLPAEVQPVGRFLEGSPGQADAAVAALGLSGLPYQIRPDGPNCGVEQLPAAGGPEEGGEEEGGEAAQEQGSSLAAGGCAAEAAEPSACCPDAASAAEGRGGAREAAGRGSEGGQSPGCERGKAGAEVGPGWQQQLQQRRQLDSPQGVGLAGCEEQRLAAFQVPATVLQNWGQCLDIVCPCCRKCCCFTKSYTRYAKGTGSVLLMPGPVRCSRCGVSSCSSEGRAAEAVSSQLPGRSGAHGADSADTSLHSSSAVRSAAALPGERFGVQEAMEAALGSGGRPQLNGHGSFSEPQGETGRGDGGAGVAGALGQQLRYFTPREIANLHSLPPCFSFPTSVSLRQRYSLLGNSVNVAVVAHLLRHLLRETIVI